MPGTGDTVAVDDTLCGTVDTQPVRILTCFKAKVIIIAIDVTVLYKDIASRVGINAIGAGAEVTIEVVPDRNAVNVNLVGIG
jgi:hypothetical protein